MRQPRHHQRRVQTGFTLVEVLVVALIIGVVMAFVSLSINPTGPADRLDTEAKRLEALATTAADDAWRDGAPPRDWLAFATATGGVAHGRHTRAWDQVGAKGVVGGM